MGKHSINNWPQEDRPREKLLRYGENALTNSELLAIILRTGTNGQSAVELARRILQEFGTFRILSGLNLPQWEKIKGLGYAKIAQIKAAIEIGRRLAEEKIKESRSKIAFSQDITDILLPRMRDLKKEVFKAVLLNSQNRIIEIIDVEEGTVNQAYPIVREIFQKALEHCAVFLICAHNHPCGNPKPSKEDRRFTKELARAGSLLQIKILDHIIIGNDKYFSFRDQGLI
ncbi:MAG: DNA repair protein RadC [Candidatus Omnitrophica bacterium]|nr:DNA repair protein RadC [Candidatus Omnitrophota bacterium]